MKTMFIKNPCTSISFPHHDRGGAGFGVDIIDSIVPGPDSLGMAVFDRCLRET